MGGWGGGYDDIRCSLPRKMMLRRHGDVRRSLLVATKNDVKEA